MYDTAAKVRFGSFQFDFAGQALSKGSLRMRLSASQIRLLGLFLKRPGAVIVRDEIAAQLWSDPRSVDVDNGINTAVNRLRYILNDNPAKPAYIETVVGLGYRWIAEVQPVWSEPREPEAAIPAAPLPEPPIPERPLPAPPLRSRFHFRGLVAALVAGAVALSALVFSTHPTGSAASLPAAPRDFHSLELVIFNDANNRVTAAAVSPSGDSIAFSDHEGVSVILTHSRARRLLNAPREFQARRIDWFPDGHQLVLSGTAKASQRQQVWTLALNGAAPQLLANDADLAAVSPDGRSVAMTVHQDTEIQILPAAGGAPRTLIRAGDKEHFPFLLWARSGRYLMVEGFGEGRLFDSEPASVSGSNSPLDTLEEKKQWIYEAVDATSGEVLAREPHLHIDSGYVLPDGRLIYLRQTLENQQALTSISAARIDARNGRVLSAAEPIDSDTFKQRTTLTASLDGTQIAMLESLGVADVFVGNLHGPGPVLEAAQQISHHSFNTFPHAWSANDDAVLVENNNLGHYAVFEQKLDGSAPRLMAQLENDAAMAEFTPDGKSILFMEFAGSPLRPRALYRVPAEGGPPEQLPVSGEIEEFHCSSNRVGRCVLRVALDDKEFVYYALDPIQGQGKELARTPWQPSVLGDWSLSPDGSTAAIAIHDSLHPRIQLINLQASAAKRLSEIAVEGVGTLLDANWAPRGDGFYVESKSEAGYALMFVDLQGQATKLRDSAAPIWGAASHDGSKLAFVETTQRSNLLTQKVSAASIR